MHTNHREVEGAPSASGADLSEIEAARALLVEESQRLLEACSAEIEAVLAKYGMRLKVDHQIVLAPQ